MTDNRDSHPGWPVSFGAGRCTVDRRIRRRATLRVLDDRGGWRLWGVTVGRREGTKKVLGGRNGRNEARPLSSSLTRFCTRFWTLACWEITVSKVYFGILLSVFVKFWILFSVLSENKNQPHESDFLVYFPFYLKLCNLIFLYRRSSKNLTAKQHQS